MTALSTRDRVLQDAAREALVTRSRSCGKCGQRVVGVGTPPKWYKPGEEEPPYGLPLNWCPGCGRMLPTS